ncbi:MAG TPA: MFS transporter, partial [Thermoleophilia bacterium]|nr:MFS transporter [Thermoleophilia bacterium]
MVTSPRGPLALVLRNPQLRRVELAWAGSIFSSCAYVIALSVIAFRADGATAVGLIMLARTASAAIASAPLSVLADRYRRRTVMASSDAVRAALLVGMAMIASAHGSNWAIYALAVVIAVVATAFRPAQASLMPQLADSPEQLTAANAISSTIEGVGFFLGPGAGGLVLATAGPAAVLWICAIAAGWSAALVYRGAEPDKDAESGDCGTPDGSRGLGAGIATLIRVPALMAVTVTYAAQALVAGALSVFTVVLAIDVLHLGNAGVGYLESALGVGGIVGGIV